MAAAFIQSGAREPGPVVVIAVEPELLASVLARLLRRRGWRVGQAGDEAEHSVREVDALIVSQNAAGPPEVNAALTIMLPDEAGSGGRVRHRDGREELLQPGAERLESLLDMLAAGR
jgi:hypothetical protein